ncbi:hypothetical protein [Pectobacterium versatile]|uniref:hypothetical protein n=1 Tax=Pectobacterium versatile TaxID=2488639 RepID=UPI001CCDD8CA|nr:hypothetical protein [Pectobacterium versatile]
MIRVINPIRTQCVNLYKNPLLNSRIDSRGILSQVNKISNAQSGITLFRGNHKLTIQHQNPPEKRVINEHGTLFQGLSVGSKISIKESNDITNTKDKKNSRLEDIKNFNAPDINKADYKEELSGYLLDKYLLDRNKLFFSPMKEDHTLPKSENDEHLKNINTKFTPEYYKLTFE